MTGPLHLLGEQTHSHRLRAAGLCTQSAALQGLSTSDAPRSPPHPLLSLAFVCLPAPEQPSQTLWSGPKPCPASIGEASAGPAPTFQLGQHLKLGREQVVEVVLDTEQLPLVVLHSSAKLRHHRQLQTSRATAVRLSRSNCFGAANQRPACSTALAIGQQAGRGGGGTACAGRAGPSQHSGIGAAGSGHSPLAPRPAAWARRGQSWESDGSGVVGPEAWGRGGWT